MKVLQIYKDYYPPVIGGIEGHINILSRGLAKRGIDVEVIVSNTTCKKDVSNIAGIKVIKAPEFGRVSSAPLNLSLPLILQKAAKDADVLHFHLPNPTATLAHTICTKNKAVIATYHSDIVRQVHLGKLYSPIQNHFLSNADSIIATSPNYLESSEILRRHKDKCSIIPLGIQIEKFNNENSKKIEYYKKKYGKNIILFIGRFRYYKGLHVLIESMRYIDGKLLIIGNGENKKFICKQIKQYNIKDKVIFLGELADNDVSACLHACDIFVLPSILRSEAFGIVLLEAMACGKPIISTELGTGTSYVNKHGYTGLVIPPNNAVKLSEAINYLLNNPEKRDEYGKNGLDVVKEQFSSEVMIDRIIRLYQKNLNNTKSQKYGHSRIDLQVKKKIKVVRIVSRLNIGGPAIHVSLLSKKLNREKFNSLLIVGTKSPLEGDMSYLLKDKNGSIRTIPELQREIYPIKDIIALFKIFKILRKERPDVVHTHLAKAGTIGRFAATCCKLMGQRNLHIVHTFHGHVLDGYFGRVKSYLFKIIEKIMARCSDRIIAISKSQQWELTQKYHIANSKKVCVINLGLDLSLFLEAENYNGMFRKKINVGKNTLLIGIIGRLVPIKNHRMFLDAAEIFLSQNKKVDIRFIIIGDGELRRELEIYTKKLNIEDSVIFCGWEKEIYKVYADLDILALTSINEGTPVSIIEAMASEVPIITTGVGGVKDLLGMYLKSQEAGRKFKECERGILCPKDNPEAFADGIQFIVNKCIKADSDMITKAKEYILHNYSEKRLIQGIESLYEQLIGDYRSGLV